MNDQPDTDEILVNMHFLDVSFFQKKIGIWGRTHHRIFPWRATSNPYHILIAELMLRRTQAQQVITVYQQFITRFPDVHALASADPDSVAHVLFSLGLAWRVPAFQRLAHTLLIEHQGHIPTDYKTLLTLPGVGDYVASAVCCFAFGQAIPVIDTNTVRVIGRLFQIKTHAESRRRTPIRRILSDLLDKQAPQDYNYALLDLAALVCLPRHPLCNECPLLHLCATGKSQRRLEGQYDTQEARNDN